MSDLKPYSGVRCMCLVTGCSAGAGCPHYTDHCKAHIAHQNAQPAQAGQVLTDDRLLAMWEGTDGEKALRPTLGKNKILSFARAIEQAVLAKRVPMTEAQIEAALWGPQPAEVWCRDFRAGVRAAERHHGIVGEKGGA